MNSEHLSSCSSFTVDGMLSKLDDLLWDHEEPYLEEIPMGKLPEIGECMSEQYTKSGFRISDSTSWIFDSSDDHNGKIALVDANTLKETVIDVEMDGKWRRLVIDNNGQHWEEIGPDYWHSQEYLQIRAAYIRAKRCRKIQAKQKRAAFRRLKRGFA